MGKFKDMTISDHFKDIMISDHRLHRPGQHTSAAALKRTRSSRETLHGKVFEILSAYGARGAIPEEIAAMNNLELIDVRRAFSVLKKPEVNRIEKTGELRMNDKGNWCEVWRAK